MRHEQGLTGKDDGFSLIELLVVMVLLSIMGTLTITAYRAYDRSQDHRGATREVVGILRNAQVRAVAEATTFECVFTTQELRIYRVTVPPTTTPTRTYTLTEPRFNSGLEFLISSPNGFLHPDGLKPSCLFYPRGSATSGIIKVRRIDTGATHDVLLEGLTARVSYED